jgi:hypothetical protein
MYLQHLPVIFLNNINEAKTAEAGVLKNSNL